MDKLSPTPIIMFWIIEARIDPKDYLIQFFRPVHPRSFYILYTAVDLWLTRQLAILS